MSKILCIWHKGCQDGFAAAWAVRDALGDDRVEFFGGVYQDPPPDVTGRHVLLVDFSYKRPILLEMAKTAKSIVVLDHHKSASEDLVGFQEFATYEEWWRLDETYHPPVVGDLEPIAVLFDMERSGAGIAWDFFHPGMARPRLIDHIEDRDLWRFALPGTREICAGMFSYPQDFVLWDDLMKDHNKLHLEGSAIERARKQDIDSFLPRVRRSMIIGGILMPVANLPPAMISDAGHLMAANDPGGVSASYYDTADARIFSLRSIDGGPDVSAIAKRFGGGGHEHVAGFKASLGWEGE